MAKSMVTPQPFLGKSLEDAGKWLRHFENYCTYKVLTETKHFQSLAGKCRLSLCFEDTSVTFDDYKTAFEARYKVPGIICDLSGPESYSSDLKGMKRMLTITSLRFT